MHHKAASPLLVTALLLGLAGCSSGGSGSGGSTIPPTVDRYVAEGDRIFADTEGLAYTDPSALPSGSADYDGVLVLGDETYAVAGDLDMNVTFGTGAIDGAVTDIVDTDGVRYSGSLGIGNGSIDTTADPETEYTFGADLTGTVTGGGETFVVDGDLYGNFVGADAGYMEGDAFVESCTSIDDCTFFEGGFIAERQ